MVFGDYIVAVWIILALFLVAVVCAMVWWGYKSRSIPLQSDTPANTGEQRHDEFITEAGSQQPPPPAGKKTV